MPETTTEGAGATTEADPFAGAVLPGNEGLDGSVAGAEGAGEGDGTQTTEGAEAETTTEGEAEKDGEATEGAEEKSEATEKAQAGKLWAGQYKTPEELAAAHEKLSIAHKHSSAEGKRLYGELKTIKESAAKQVAELQEKLSLLELQAKLGPELKEPTDEELEKMGPVAATRLLNRLSEQKALRAKLEDQAKQSKAAAEREAQELKTHQEAILRKLESDPEQYPFFAELKPAMDRLMDIEPGVTGHPGTPMILYLAALGQRTLSERGKVKAKETAAREAAKGKTAAAAAATAAPGATAGGTKDRTQTTEKRTPDEVANERLLEAHSRRHPELL